MSESQCSSPGPGRYETQRRFEGRPEWVARGINGLYWSRSGSVSNPELPQTEAEILQFYQQRIMDAQQRHLEPLREDIADWLNKTLELEHLSADTLLDALDDGVLLCHLARFVQHQAKSIIDAGWSEEVVTTPEVLINGHEPPHHESPTLSESTPTKAIPSRASWRESRLKAAQAVPANRIRCWEQAPKQSFFARENASFFIKFCRTWGVHDNLLFESEGLVKHTEPRNVILSLLEVGRLASHLDVEPPGLVQLERDIEQQMERHRLELLEQDRCIPPVASLNKSLTLMAVGEPAISVSPSNGNMEHSEDDGRDSLKSPVILLNKDGDKRLHVKSELDKKVEQLAIASQVECRCVQEHCARLQIYKISEGLYSIGGKNIFVRLFKERHVMVRVGGGWDTFEHYLIRHDPCRSRSSRSPTPETKKFTRLESYRSSLPALADETSHLPDAAKENGPKPAEVRNRPRKVVRSLTLNLSQNQSPKSPNPSTPVRRSSFRADKSLPSKTTKQLSRHSTAFEGTLQLTPEPSRTLGFSFARAPVARNVLLKR